MMRRLVFSAGFLCALTVTPALAQDDLDRIPAAIPAPVAPPSTPKPGERLYLQNDIVVSAARGALAVAAPPPKASTWEERLMLDVHDQWQLAQGLHVVYSGRLNLRAGDGLGFPDRENIRHDLREAYLAWDAGGGTFVDLGRINLKSGVALGFNPTDFFKTRAVVEPLSADPSTQREDRLGTLMLRAQHIWDGGTLTLVFAPRVANKSAIYANNTLPSLDPMFDRTNAANRFFIKTSLNLGADLSPEFVYFLHGSASHFGLNLTRGFGQNVVGYLEWAGGTRASLAADALAFGRATRTLPAAAPPPFLIDAARSFQNDLSLGFSYTTQDKITFNLEYEFHQAGFSGADWTRWFAAGTPQYTFADGSLWYLRGYAADQGEPMSRHMLFVRVERDDAFVPDLDLTSFAQIDLHDGSGFAQVSADYYLSSVWTIGALASVSTGGSQSDFGSLPTAAGITIKVSRYF